MRIAVSGATGVVGRRVVPALLARGHAVTALLRPGGRGETLARLGSLGRTLARSLRLSNRRLREATGWRPRLPSVREGWPATVAEMRAAGLRL